MTAVPMRVCRLTPEGRGAVAVVGVSGPNAVATVARHFRAASGKPLANQPLARIAYGRWGEGEGEDLVVVRRAPDEVEVHCHGGPQSSAQIVGDLVAADCVAVEWREWTTGRPECPLAAAAQLALADALTLPAAAILLDQYHGAMRREIVAIQAELHGPRSDSAAGRLEKLLARAEVGLHLTKPWRVVIGGRPNVGKSSLINALVGYRRAIVFDQPGTTRDIVSATTAINGWPVELSDTAGLQATTDDLESAGIALAREQLRQADVVVWVVDATELRSKGVRGAPEMARRQADEMTADVDWDRALVVANKIDLIDDVTMADEENIATCAVSGAGVERLLQRLATMLVPDPPPAGAAVPVTAGQAKLLTDALLACQRDDIPAADAVVGQLLRNL